MVSSMTPLFGKIVVTGGAGFIGSHFIDLVLSKQLAEKIIIVDNLSSGSRKNISHHLETNKVELVVADLKNFDRGWVNKFRDAEAVVHLAANPEVRISSIEPRVHFNENVVATFNVLEASRLNDVKVHLFASSSTVYGVAKVFPTPETYPYEPISVYGASKAACEILYRTYHSLYGFSVAIARYANIIGPRVKPWCNNRLHKQAKEEPDNTRNTRRWNTKKEAICTCKTL